MSRNIFDLLIIFNVIIFMQREPRLCYNLNETKQLKYLF